MIEVALTSARMEAIENHVTPESTEAVTAQTNMINGAGK